MINRLRVFTAILCAAVPSSTAQLRAQQSEVKNIILVHGAWADGSGWRGVYDNLVRDGFHVSIVQEPETSFKDDVAATKRVLAQQEGRCILVGHSYGGAVITEAGTDASVAGLVYVAAHMPDAGEDEADDGKRFPSDLAKSGAIKKTPDGFTYIDPSRFHELFAADLSDDQAAFMARSQVLNFADNFSAAITTAAWKSKPSWMVVAGRDRTINPNLERWYAKRAKSHMIEIAGASHSVYVSHPKEVAHVIESAAGAFRSKRPLKSRVLKSRQLAVRPLGGFCHRGCEMNAGLLLPGHGSEPPRMLNDLVRHPAVEEILSEVSAVLDLYIRTLDTPEALQSAVSVQLAILTAGVATARALQQSGLAPFVVAGLSVGPFSAGVAADSISLADELRLVHSRAERMEQMVPFGSGLSAIDGLSEAQAAKLVDAVNTKEHPVFAGNINTQRQFRWFK